MEREWLGWPVGAQVFRSVSRGLEHVWESLFFDPLRAGGGATAASGTWKGLVCGLAWALSGVVFARWPDGVFHRAGKTRNRPRPSRSRPAPLSR